MKILLLSTFRNKKKSEVERIADIKLQNIFYELNREKFACLIDNKPDIELVEEFNDKNLSQAFKIYADPKY